MSRHSNFVSFKKIININEAIDLIKISSNWCFFVVGLIIFSGIIHGVSTIPISDTCVFIAIGIGLRKYKSRALAYLLLVEYIFMFLPHITIQRLSSLYYCYFIFSGVQAIRATSAYYRFNKASVSIKNFVIKLIVTSLYFSIFVFLLAVIILLINPNSNNVLFVILCKIFLSVFFFLGYAGKLPFTKKFEIVTFNLVEEPIQIMEFSSTGF